MISVIDIGTNTIRAVRFDGTEEIENFSEQSAILEHTENGVLTEAGIQDLENKLKILTQKLSEKAYIFATSAFRSLKNQEEVKEHIEETLGLGIDVLSGEEEAECDAVSLMNIKGIDTGIGADLGGGSCQIFAFEKGNLKKSSIPIGVKRLKRQFVSGTIPTEEERKKIIKFVKSSINFPNDADTLYIMGGTARAVLTLLQKLTDIKGANFPKSKLKNVADFAFDSTALAMLKMILPKRFDSVGIGIDVICLLAECVGAENIEVVSCGVREGYLIKKLKKNP